MVYIDIGFKKILCISEDNFTIEKLLQSLILRVVFGRKLDLVGILGIKNKKRTLFFKKNIGKRYKN